MKVFLANRVYTAVNAAGTGPVTLGQPLKGYQSPLEAGIPDGVNVRYVIEEAFAWELGWGVYDGATGTITRNLVQSSTGALLELGSGATIFLTAAGEDIVQPDDLAAVAGDLAALGADVAALEGEVDGIAASLGGYLPLSGGTMVGVLELDGGPGDYLLPLRLLKGGNIWGIGADDTANLAVVKGINTVAQFEDIGSTASGAVTVMTRQKGDARYLQLSGGELTSALTINGGVYIDGPSSNEGFIRFRGPTDALIADVGRGTTGITYLRSYTDAGVMNGAFILDPSANRAYVSGGIDNLEGYNLVALANRVFFGGRDTATSDYIQWVTGGAGLYGYENGALTFRISTSGSQVTKLPGVYGQTSTSAANVYVATDGSMLRSTSAGRFKTDVEELPGGLDLIGALRPVFFRSLHEHDDKDRQFLGFINEEVQGAIPAAKVDDDNYDPRSIIAALVKAVQELTARVKELEAKDAGV